jgi:hypothetical protein
MFIMACIIFGLARATLRRSQNTNKHRERILGAGQATGLALTLKTQVFLMSVKACLAWSIIAALIASSVVRRSFRGLCKMERMPSKKKVLGLIWKMNGLKE